MNKIYSLVAFSLLFSRITSTSIFDTMRSHFEQMEHHMKEMLHEFDQELEKGPGFVATEQNSKALPISIAYDDAEHVLVSLTFPPEMLKEVDAEAFEKQKTALIVIPQEDGQTTLKIDRAGIQYSSQQKSEKKQTGDEKESAFISYSNQHFYRSSEVPVDAAKASVKIKGDELVITLPRENKKKKIEVTRETL